MEVDATIAVDVVVKLENLALHAGFGRVELRGVLLEKRGLVWRLELLAVGCVGRGDKFFQSECLKMLREV